ncbi:MAG: tetratricopeptide repeat protein [Nitrospinae bacterium]|nr:tetratricopeptide repeat protein [Nitrospinota bacterium]
MRKIFVGLIAVMLLLIACGPNNMSLYSDGLMYERNKEFDKAIKNYTIVIENQRKWDFFDRAPYFRRGDLYHNTGQYDKAIEDFTWLINMPPLSPAGFKLTGVDLANYKASNFDAYFRRGKAYYNAGQYDKAIADFNVLISKKNGGFPTETFYLIGFAYYNTGQYDKAIDNFIRVLEIPIESEKIGTSSIEDTTKRWKSSIEDAIKGKNLLSTLSNGYIRYADADKGEKNKVNGYSRAIELDKDSIVAYKKRGTFYEAKRQYANAMADFQKVCDMGDKDGCKKFQELSPVAENMRIITERNAKYIDLYHKTLTQLKCGHSMHEINGVGELKIGEGVYVTYQAGQGITDVKIPVSVSQELMFAIKDRGIKTGMSMDLSFYLWMSQTILDTTSPGESMPILCYLVSLSKKGDFQTLQVFVNGYVRDKLGR